MHSVKAKSSKKYSPFPKFEPQCEVKLMYICMYVSINIYTFVQQTPMSVMTTTEGASKPVGTAWAATPVSVTPATQSVMTGAHAEVRILTSMHPQSIG